MTLPSMPAMPAMSLPSVPMPSMSLPGLSLPDWIPLGPYSSSPVATPQVKAAVSSSTADQLGRGPEAAQQSTLGKGEEPATSSYVSAEASRSVKHEKKNKAPSTHEPSPADSMNERAENSSLPISTHATGVQAGMAEHEAVQLSGSGHASKADGEIEKSPSRISSPDVLQLSSTSAKVCSAKTFRHCLSALRPIATQHPDSLCKATVRVVCASLSQWPAG